MRVSVFSCIFVYVCICIYIFTYLCLCLCLYLYFHASACNSSHYYPGSLTGELTQLAMRDGYLYFHFSLYLYLYLCFIWICICTCIHKVSQASSQYDSGSLTGELTEPAVKVSCYNLLFANPLTGHWLVNDHHNFHNNSQNSFWLLQFTEGKAMEESRCLTFWR